MPVAAAVDCGAAVLAGIVMMQATTRARLRAVHGGAGALFGIVLFVILFTGTWSAACQSMRDWWQPPRKEIPGGGMKLDHLLPLAAAHGIDLRHARIVLPQSGDFSVRFCAPQGQACKLVLDPASATPLPPPPSSANILVTVHKNLYAGFPGRIFVSLFGIVLLVLLVGGAAMHGLHWKRSVRVRCNHGLHVRLFDLHGIVGVWALPWLLLFGITGALSGLGALATLTLAPVAFPDQPGQLFTQLMGLPAPTANNVAWQQTPSIDAILHEDAHKHPDFLPQAVVLHHWGDANASVEIAGMTHGIPSTAVFERHLYRASDVTLLQSASARGRGFWLRAFIAIQPLHFAHYEWSPAASVWHGLHVWMGIAACVLTATGLYLWIRRYRAKQPRMTRLLAALAIGVCAGLVLGASLLLMAGQLQTVGIWRDAWNAPLFWNAWGMTLVTACVMQQHAVLLRRLITVSGMGYVLAALLHAALALAWGNPFLAWQTDVSLILLGLALLWHARIQGREHPHSRTSCEMPPQHDTGKLPRTPAGF